MTHCVIVITADRDGPPGNDVEPRFLNPFGLMPCVSSFTEPGLCLSSSVCGLVGGTEGGECFFGKSCCVINSKSLSQNDKAHQLNL